MLLPFYNKDLIEAGCDEAGRGCLAGSVFAAAVILPKDYHNDILNDSKQLLAKKRYQLRGEIQRDAIAWAVGEVITRERRDEYPTCKYNCDASCHRSTENTSRGFNYRWKSILSI